VITDRATATIGDAKIYGTIRMIFGGVVFSGGYVKLKKPLKNPIATLLKRLNKDKKCTITDADGKVWSNKDRSYNLVRYSIGIQSNPIRYNISFTIEEKNE